MNARLNNLFRLTVVAALLASLAAAAAVKPNPYAKIAERNVFKLRSPEVRPEIAPPPPRRPHPAVAITGLVELRGSAKVLVEVTEPGRSVKRSILADGGAFDLLEILHIDVAGERVRVRIDGDEEVLTIEKPKTPAARPAPPLIPAVQKPSMPLRG